MYAVVGNGEISLNCSVSLMVQLLMIEGGNGRNSGGISIIFLTSWMVPKLFQASFQGIYWLVKWKFGYEHHVLLKKSDNKRMNESEKRALANASKTTITVMLVFYFAAQAMKKSSR